MTAPDPEDERTMQVLRQLADAMEAAEAHFNPFDGGFDVAIEQSVDDWTNREWDGYIVYVSAQVQSDRMLDHYDRIKLRRLKQQGLRPLWGGIFDPPEPSP